jgi:hypothetical protein
MGDEKPKGVVAVLVGPDGRAVASASDFDLSGYGGYSLEEGQTHRIRDAIAHRVAEAMASSDFTKNMSTYERRKVVEAMIAKDGYRLHIIPIGHEVGE